jgi:non-ribosomal peptide synthetase component F
LLRARLLRLEPERHRFLLTVHHIAFDGWSAWILMRELAALYGGAPLPELPVQYADYALWQRQWLAGPLREEQLAWWRERLGGERPVLELPTDRPRPAVQTFTGRTVSNFLPPTVTAALRALGRREGATLFMVLLAAFDVLLQRLSGQDDLLVGTPVAGRRRIETEGLIGFFLNTLVLRTDLSGDPPFRALLGRVREAALGAYAHQDVPFEALLADLQPERDLSRTPLFQVFFNLLNLPERRLHLPGLDLALQQTEKAPAKFDLTVYVSEGADAGEDGLRFDIVYNADLFDAARITALQEQFAAVLAQVAEQPAIPIGELSLATASALAVLPDPTAPLDGSWVGAIHELFAARALAAPERPAISDREGAWTYGELATAAAGVAGWLAAEAGVRRGDRVAIWVHRSAPVAAAVLGALRAGGAFTLLDPAYPAPRLVEMLRIATPHALIRMEAAGPLPEAVEEWLAAAGCPRLDLPGDGAAAVLARVEGMAKDVDVEIGPEDIAVVGFTSGSTGTPKAILGRHGPLTHFLPWQCARFELSGEDRFSLLSGLAHDPLQRDLFTPFFLGWRASG